MVAVAKGVPSTVTVLKRVVLDTVKVEVASTVLGAAKSLPVQWYHP